MENKLTSIENYQFLLNQEPKFNLREFLVKYLLNYWYLFVMSFLLTYMAVWLYLRYTIPKYEIKSSILIKVSEGESSSITEEFLLQDLGVASNFKNLENEIQILKSRTLMNEVVERLKLNQRYFTKGRVRTIESYSNPSIIVDSLTLKDSTRSLIFILKVKNNHQFELLRGEQSLGNYNFGDLVSTKYGTIRFQKSFTDIPTSDLVFRYDPSELIAKVYSALLKIKNLGTYSSVLELSLRDSEPQKAADLINKLIEIYNETSIEDKNRVSKNTLEFIEERVGVLSEELELVESSMASFKSKSKIPIEASSNIDFLLDEYRQNDRNVENLYIQKNLLAAILEFMSAPENEDKLVPLGGEILNTGISSLIGNYNGEILKKEKLLRSAVETNPVIIDIQDQLKNLRSIIIVSIEKILEEVGQKLAVYEENLLKNQSNIKSIPGREKALLEIKRQQSIKESLYLYLLQKKEETALSLVVTAPNSRVVDRAKYMGASPISPKKQNIHAIAFLIGVLLPFGIIFLKNQLNDKVLSEDDITKRVGASIVGRIFYTKDKVASVITGSSGRSAIGEMFRLTRANLDFYSPDQLPKVIMVSSSIGGEGKTFITVNLGASIALANKKTIVLGLDLRKPKLTEYFENASSSVGISSYIVNDEPVESVIQQSSINENLFFINSGPIPPNPSELLVHPRMTQLIEHLKESFDYILFDTPPLGLVADAFLLNKYVTTSLFVVRFGHTRLRMLDLIEDVQKENKINNVGIVFNGLKKTGGYYGYGNYNYGYGYGYGYYEADKKPGLLRRLFTRK